MKVIVPYTNKTTGEYVEVETIGQFPLVSNEVLTKGFASQQMENEFYEAQKQIYITHMKLVHKSIQEALDGVE